MRYSGLGLVFTVAKSYGLFTPLSGHRPAALLSSNQNIVTVLTLLFILFWFLTHYRPCLQDWGTVNWTQTSISKHPFYLLLLNPIKTDYFFQS